MYVCMYIVHTYVQINIHKRKAGETMQKPAKAPLYAFVNCICQRLSIVSLLLPITLLVICNKILMYQSPTFTFYEKENFSVIHFQKLLSVSLDFYRTPCTRFN